MQPPSGGCVLKQQSLKNHFHAAGQPPSGGCVLKQSVINFSKEYEAQPPSGGCVLKLIKQRIRHRN